MDILAVVLAIGLVVLGVGILAITFSFLMSLIGPLLEAVFNFAEDLARKLFGP